MSPPSPPPEDIQQQQTSSSVSQPTYHTSVHATQGSPPSPLDSSTDLPPITNNATSFPTPANVPPQSPDSPYSTYYQSPPVHQQFSPSPFSPQSNPTTHAPARGSEPSPPPSPVATLPPLAPFQEGSAYQRYQQPTTYSPTSPTTPESPQPPLSYSPASPQSQPSYARTTPPPQSPPTQAIPFQPQARVPVPLSAQANNNSPPYAYASPLTSYQSNPGRPPTPATYSPPTNATTPVVPYGVTRQSPLQRPPPSSSSSPFNPPPPSLGFLPKAPGVEFVPAPPGLNIPPPPGVDFVEANNKVETPSGQVETMAQAIAPQIQAPPPPDVAQIPRGRQQQLPLTLPVLPPLASRSYQPQARPAPPPVPSLPVSPVQPSLAIPSLSQTPASFARSLPLGVAPPLTEIGSPRGPIAQNGPVIPSAGIRSPAHVITLGTPPNAFNAMTAQQTFQSPYLPPTDVNLASRPPPISPRLSPMTSLQRSPALPIVPGPPSLPIATPQRQLAAPSPTPPSYAPYSPATAASPGPTASPLTPATYIAPEASYHAPSAGLTPSLASQSAPITSPSQPGLLTPPINTTSGLSPPLPTLPLASASNPAPQSTLPPLAAPQPSRYNSVARNAPPIAQPPSTSQLAQSTANAPTDLTNPIQPSQGLPSAPSQLSPSVPPTVPSQSSSQVAGQDPAPATSSVVYPTASSSVLASTSTLAQSTDAAAPAPALPPSATVQSSGNPTSTSNASPQTGTISAPYSTEDSTASTPASSSISADVGPSLPTNDSGGSSSPDLNPGNDNGSIPNAPPTPQSNSTLAPPSQSAAPSSPSPSASPSSALGTSAAVAGGVGLAAAGGALGASALDTSEKVGEAKDSSSTASDIVTTVDPGTASNAGVSAPDSTATEAAPLPDTSALSSTNTETSAVTVPSDLQSSADSQPAQTNVSSPPANDSSNGVTAQTGSSQPENEPSSPAESSDSSQTAPSGETPINEQTASGIGAPIATSEAASQSSTMPDAEASSEQSAATIAVPNQPADVQSALEGASHTPADSSDTSGEVGVSGAAPSPALSTNEGGVDASLPPTSSTSGVAVSPSISGMPGISDQAAAGDPPSSDSDQSTNLPTVSDQVGGGGDLQPQSDPVSDLDSPQKVDPTEDSGLPRSNSDLNLNQPPQGGGSLPDQKGGLSDDAQSTDSLRPPLDTGGASNIPDSTTGAEETESTLPPTGATTGVEGSSGTTATPGLSDQPPVGDAPVSDPDQPVKSDVNDEVGDSAQTAQGEDLKAGDAQPGAVGDTATPAADEGGASKGLNTPVDGMPGAEKDPVDAPHEKALVDGVPGADKDAVDGTPGADEKDNFEGPPGADKDPVDGAPGAEKDPLDGQLGTDAVGGGGGNGVASTADGIDGGGGGGLGVGGGSMGAGDGLSNGTDAMGNGAAGSGNMMDGGLGSGDTGMGGMGGGTGGMGDGMGGMGGSGGGLGGGWDGDSSGGGLGGDSGGWGGNSGGGWGGSGGGWGNDANVGPNNDWSERRERRGDGESFSDAEADAIERDRLRKMEEDRRQAAIDAEKNDFKDGEAEQQRDLVKSASRFSGSRSTTDLRHLEEQLEAAKDRVQQVSSQHRGNGTALNAARDHLFGVWIDLRQAQAQDQEASAELLSAHDIAGSESELATLYCDVEDRAMKKLDASIRARGRRSDQYDAAQNYYNLARSLVAEFEEKLEEDVEHNRTAVHQLERRINGETNAHTLDTLKHQLTEERSTLVELLQDLELVRFRRLEALHHNIRLEQEKIKYLEREGDDRDLEEASEGLQRLKDSEPDERRKLEEVRGELAKYPSHQHDLRMAEANVNRLKERVARNPRDAEAKRELAAAETYLGSLSAPGVARSEHLASIERSHEATMSLSRAQAQLKVAEADTTPGHELRLVAAQEAVKQAEAHVQQSKVAEEDSAKRVANFPHDAEHESEVAQLHVKHLRERAAAGDETAARELPNAERHLGVESQLDPHKIREGFDGSGPSVLIEKIREAEKQGNSPEVLKLMGELFMEFRQEKSKSGEMAGRIHDFREANEKLLHEFRQNERDLKVHSEELQTFSTQLNHTQPPPTQERLLKVDEALRDTNRDLELAKRRVVEPENRVQTASVDHVRALASQTRTQKEVVDRSRKNLRLREVEERRARQEVARLGRPGSGATEDTIRAAKERHAHLENALRQHQASYREQVNQLRAMEGETAKLAVGPEIDDEGRLKLAQDTSDHTQGLVRQHAERIRELEEEIKANPSSARELEVDLRAEQHALRQAEQHARRTRTEADHAHQRAEFSRHGVSRSQRDAALLQSSTASRRLGHARQAVSDAEHQHRRAYSDLAVAAKSRDPSRIEAAKKALNEAKEREAKAKEELEEAQHHHALARHTASHAATLHAHQASVQVTAASWAHHDAIARLSRSGQTPEEAREARTDVTRTAQQLEKQREMAREASHTANNVKHPSHPLDTVELLATRLRLAKDQQGEAEHNVGALKEKLKSSGALSKQEQSLLEAQLRHEEGILNLSSRKVESLEEKVELAKLRANGTANHEEATHQLQDSVRERMPLEDVSTQGTGWNKQWEQLRVEAAAETKAAKTFASLSRNLDTAKKRYAEVETQTGAIEVEAKHGVDVAYAAQVKGSRSLYMAQKRHEISNQHFLATLREVETTLVQQKQSLLLAVNKRQHSPQEQQVFLPHLHQIESSLAAVRTHLRDAEVVEERLQKSVHEYQLVQHNTAIRRQELAHRRHQDTAAQLAAAKSLEEVARAEQAHSTAKQELEEANNKLNHSSRQLASSAIDREGRAMKRHHLNLAAHNRAKKLVQGQQNPSEDDVKSLEEARREKAITAGHLRQAQEQRIHLSRGLSLVDKRRLASQLGGQAQSLTAADRQRLQRINAELEDYSSRHSAPPEYLLAEKRSTEADLESAEISRQRAEEKDFKKTALQSTHARNQSRNLTTLSDATTAEFSKQQALAAAEASGDAETTRRAQEDLHRATRRREHAHATVRRDRGQLEAQDNLTSNQRQALEHRSLQATQAMLRRQRSQETGLQQEVHQLRAMPNRSPEEETKLRAYQYQLAKAQAQTKLVEGFERKVAERHAKATRRVEGEAAHLQGLEREAEQHRREIARLEGRFEEERRGSPPNHLPAEAKSTRKTLEAERKELKKTRAAVAELKREATRGTHADDIAFARFTPSSHDTATSQASPPSSSTPPASSLTHSTPSTRDDDRRAESQALVSRYPQETPEQRAAKVARQEQELRREREEQLRVEREKAAKILSTLDDAQRLETNAEIRKEQNNVLADRRSETQKATPTQKKAEEVDLEGERQSRERARKQIQAQNLIQSTMVAQRASTAASFAATQRVLNVDQERRDRERARQAMQNLSQETATFQRAATTASATEQARREVDREKTAAVMEGSRLVSEAAAAQREFTRSQVVEEQALKFQTDQAAAERTRHRHDATQVAAALERESDIAQRSEISKEQGVARETQQRAQLGAQTQVKARESGVLFANELVRTSSAAQRDETRKERQDEDAKLRAEQASRRQSDLEESHRRDEIARREEGLHASADLIAAQRTAQDAEIQKESLAAQQVENAIARKDDEARVAWERRKVEARKNVEVLDQEIEAATKAEVERERRRGQHLTNAQVRANMDKLVSDVMRAQATETWRERAAESANQRASWNPATVRNSLMRGAQVREQSPPNFWDSHDRRNQLVRHQRER